MCCKCVWRNCSVGWKRNSCWLMQETWRNQPIKNDFSKIGFLLISGPNISEEGGFSLRQGLYGPYLYANELTKNIDTNIAQGWNGCMSAPVSKVSTPQFWKPEVTLLQQICWPKLKCSILVVQTKFRVFEEDYNVFVWQGFQSITVSQKVDVFSTASATDPDTLNLILATLEFLSIPVITSWTLTSCPNSPREIKTVSGFKKYALISISLWFYSYILSRF